MRIPKHICPHCHRSIRTRDRALWRGLVYCKRCIPLAKQASMDRLAAEIGEDAATALKDAFKKAFGRTATADSQSWDGS